MIKDCPYLAVLNRSTAVHGDARADYLLCWIGQWLLSWMSQTGQNHGCSHDRQSRRPHQHSNQPFPTQASCNCPRRSVRGVWISAIQQANMSEVGASRLFSIKRNCMKRAFLPACWYAACVSCRVGHNNKHTHSQLQGQSQPAPLNNKTTTLRQPWAVVQCGLNRVIVVGKL
jgi:hypothetical protein